MNTNYKMNDTEMKTAVMDSLTVLPGYIRFLLENRLEEFIALQWRVSEEVKAPIVKHFSGMSEAERIRISIEPTRDFWGYLARGEMRAQINDWLDKWKKNQMPVVTNDQVIAEDITKANYIRRTALILLLDEYTNDIKHYKQVSAEIDFYLQELLSATLQLYITMQSEKMEAINRHLVLNEEQLLEAQRIANMGSFEIDLIGQRITSYTPQLVKIFEMDRNQLSLEDFIERVHPDDRDLFLTRITNALQKGEPYEFEYRLHYNEVSKVIWSKGQIKMEHDKPAYLSGTIMDITDRHQVLKELKQQDYLYKESQALTHLGNWAWEVHEDKVQWSDELYRIYGLEPQSEVINFARFLTLIHPEERDKHVKRTQDSLAKGTGSEYDMRIMRPTGEVRIIHCKNQIVVNDMGESVRMSGTCQDITAEHKLRKRLEEGNKFAEALIDASEDVITAFDRNLTLIAINKKACDRFSFDRDVVLGKHVMELFPQSNAERTEDLIKVLNGENIRYSNKSLISDELFDIQLMPLLNNASEVYGVLSVAHNITDSVATDIKISELSYNLEKQQEILRRNDEQYQKMIGEVQDYAIILLDTDGTIRNWNKGAEKIKGYSADEAVGKNFRIFYVRDDQNRNLPEKLIHTAVQEGRAEHEGWRIRKDGTKFWGSTVITALHDNGGKITGFSKVTRDLSERKAAEEKLKEQNALLESGNELLKRKNKELSAFSHVASHDLQEPLRKIRTFASLILEPVPGQEGRAQEYLERIVNASSNMQGFIDDLLTYSKTHDVAAQVEEVNLQEMIDILIEENITPVDSVSVTITSDPMPFVQGVKFQLRQLFQNVISNSIKYRNEHVAPVINISYACVPGSQVMQTDVDQSKQYHLIGISDNGIGFEQEFADKIFEPFQRLHTKSQYSGTGIGLAICKTIVHNHNGFIWAESSLTEGATFYVALPV